MAASSAFAGHLRSRAIFSDVGLSVTASNSPGDELVAALDSFFLGGLRSNRRACCCPDLILSTPTAAADGRVSRLASLLTLTPAFSSAGSVLAEHGFQQMNRLDVAVAAQRGFARHSGLLKLGEFVLSHELEKKSCYHRLNPSHRGLFCNKRQRNRAGMAGPTLKNQMMNINYRKKYMPEQDRCLVRINSQDGGGVAPVVHPAAGVKASHLTRTAGEQMRNTRPTVLAAPVEGSSASRCWRVSKQPTFPAKGDHKTPFAVNHSAPGDEPKRSPT
jgi:hypothetical protein